MFENIFYFGIRRSTKQAWGFYLGHLLIMFILGAIAGFVQSFFYPLSESFMQGFQRGLNSGVGPVLALVYVGIITFIMFQQKKLLKHFKYIALFLMALVLAGLGGGILGLIIPAVVSTKPIDNSAEPITPSI